MSANVSKHIRVTYNNKAYIAMVVVDLCFLVTAQNNKPIRANVRSSQEKPCVYKLIVWPNLSVNEFD